MGVITLPTTFVDGTIPTAAQFNGDFSAIANEFNGSISNANISASAAISASKISGTAATLTGTETLTNKTLTSPAITTPTITNGTITKPTLAGVVPGNATYTPSAGGTATLDLTSTTRHLVTMPAGNITIAVSNATVGQIFTVEITQDSGGSRTVTWFTTIRWAGGSAPTLTTTASKRDSFGFIVTGSGTYDGFIIGQNI